MSREHGVRQWPVQGRNVSTTARPQGAKSGGGGPLVAAGQGPAASSGDRERRLPPPRGRTQLDAVDPFDPPEATAAGSDQAGRGAVPGRERGAAGGGGGQQPVQVAAR